MFSTVDRRWRPGARPLAKRTVQRRPVVLFSIFVDVFAKELRVDAMWKVERGRLEVKVYGGFECTLSRTDINHGPHRTDAQSSIRCPGPHGEGFVQLVLSDFSGGNQPPRFRRRRTGQPAAGRLPHHVSSPTGWQFELPEKSGSSASSLQNLYTSPGGTMISMGPYIGWITSPLVVAVRLLPL
jgi:hypothetical protein